jgi:NitT/TauT family transport system substrate-binding protein
VSSDLFVVREETYQAQARAAAALPARLPRRRGLDDDAARRGGAARVKRAIDGTDPTLSVEIIKLRNAASESELTRKQGLGTMDVASLQAAADTYRKLGWCRTDRRQALRQQRLLPSRQGSRG